MQDRNPESRTGSPRKDWWSIRRNFFKTVLVGGAAALFGIAMKPEPDSVVKPIKPTPLPTPGALPTPTAPLPPNQPMTPEIPVPSFVLDENLNKLLPSFGGVPLPPLTPVAENGKTNGPPPPDQLDYAAIAFDEDTDHPEDNFYKDVGLKAVSTLQYLVGIAQASGLPAEDIPGSTIKFDTLPPDLAKLRFFKYQLEDPQNSRQDVDFITRLGKVTLKPNTDIQIVGRRFNGEYVITYSGYTQDQRIPSLRYAIVDSTFIERTLMGKKGKIDFNGEDGMIKFYLEEANNGRVETLYKWSINTISEGLFKQIEEKIREKNAKDSEGLKTATPLFVGAMKAVTGIELKPKQVKSRLTLKTFEAIKDKDDNPLLIAVHQFKPDDPSRNGEMLEKATPLVLSQDGGKTWEVCDSGLLCRLAGVNMTSRISMSNPELTKRVATKVKMEAGDMLELFNPNFDWEKITTNWDETLDKLESGIIPFEEEAFNPNKRTIREAQTQRDFAVKNGMTIVGDTLFFAPKLVEDFLTQFPPDKQKKILLFMAAAKIIKFPEISEIDLVSEIAVHLAWNDRVFNPKFEALGGINFLKDLATLVKRIRPELKLMVTEDYVVDAVESNDALRRHKEEFFGLLAALKNNSVPVDGVKFENQIWIGSPPTERSITTAIKKAKDLGYEIEGSDTIVAISKAHPQHPESWSLTRKDYLANPQYGQAEIYYLIFSSYLRNGATELGVFNITDNEDWLSVSQGADYSSNMFDRSGKPKISYYLLTTAVYEDLLKRTPQKQATNWANRRTFLRALTGRL